MVLTMGCAGSFGGLRCLGPYLRRMSAPTFTVVMPVYLGDYSGNYGRSATDRRAKLIRAVQSVVAQRFTGWELMIVADGCDETWAMRDELQAMDTAGSIRVTRVPKQRIWSGVPRSVGIVLGTGRYVRYLDSDDMLGPSDLWSIAEGLEAAGWPDLALVGDRVYSAGEDRWYNRAARETRENGIGCSNIVVVRDERRALWPEIVYRHPHNGYDHDRQYFRQLCQHFTPVHIEGGQYHVMHVPRQYDL